MKGPNYRCGELPPGFLLLVRLLHSRGQLPPSLLTAAAGAAAAALAAAAAAKTRRQGHAVLAHRRDEVVEKVINSLPDDHGSNFQ